MMMLPHSRLAATICVAVLLGQHVSALAQNIRASPGPETSALTAATGMGLSQVEQIATTGNPTLAQTQAVIQAARGRLLQAGLLPNPVVGGAVDNFAFKSPGNTPTYSGFVVTTIPLGGKLAKMRRIMQAELSQAELEAFMQNLRVMNAVRSAFYQVVGAQQAVDMRRALAENGRTATATTASLYNIGQADKPDYFESEIEREQMAHDLQAATNNHLQKWKVFAALLGKPDMPLARLEANLEQGVGTIDEAQVTARILGDSPQIRMAQAQVQRAQAVVARARVEAVPDLFVRGALGYNREFLDAGGGGGEGAEAQSSRPERIGLVGAAQVGVTLPIFNRNQGGIASARSEVTFAQHGLERTRLALRVQLAGVLRDYNTALDAIARYRKIILPRAEAALQLYQQKFKEMSASYPQVLIAQRNVLSLRQRYVNALVNAQQDTVLLNGFLLSGGLEAPRMQFGEGNEITGLAGTMQASGGDIDALDEAHNVDHY